MISPPQKELVCRLACIACLSLAGCTKTAAPPVATPAAPPAPVVLAAEPAVETPAAPETTTPQEAAPYTPPFEDRADLFAPPARQQSAARNDDGSGESIELKGFVDVGGLQAVLAIGGVVTPVPAGAEKFGVQVISISPPTAVLQRGRTRWTASLH